MIRRALIIRGALLFRRVTDDDWLSLTPLIVTGALFFWWAQMVRGASTVNCHDVLFLSVSAHIFGSHYLQERLFFATRLLPGLINVHDKPVNLLFDFMMGLIWNVAI